jgi:hypothetical protein
VVMLRGRGLRVVQEVQEGRGREVDDLALDVILYHAQRASGGDHLGLASTLNPPRQPVKYEYGVCHESGVCQVQ